MDRVKILYISDVDELLQLPIGTEIEAKLSSNMTDAFWRLDEDGLRLVYADGRETRPYKPSSMFFKGARGTSISRGVYEPRDLVQEEPPKLTFSLGDVLDTEEKYDAAPDGTIVRIAGDDFNWPPSQKKNGRWYCEGSSFVVNEKVARVIIYLPEEK